ncbi:MAG: polyprenyl synthetase family protein [Pseudomarimonas sp.]
MLRSWIARVDSTLAQVLPALESEPKRLHAAMRYAALSPGKRLRPLLVYASGHALSIAEEQLDAAAAAVELIHAYSLIHDDLPAMDDDDLRRGRPTVHIAFDEATAILAGDALQALAFEVLTRAPVAAERCLAMVRRLTIDAGAAGMAGGQALDLAAVGNRIDEQQLIAMHARKTGALIQSCAALASLAADAEPPVATSLHRFASALGLAFQIRDDLLDVEASSADLGKTAGKDAAADKPTYFSMLGIELARRRLAEQSQLMQQALGELQGDTTPLAALATLTVARMK